MEKIKTETEIEKDVVCIYCKSPKVIKHGKTSTGNKRYRCRTCGKTWVVEKNEIIRPDIAEVVEAYLDGRTYRDLVSVFHSSPLRINQKIREYLEGCPNWEEYLDTCTHNHTPRLIYLVGRNFSCSTKDTANNSMYLVMAIDALSTVVLGYEIGLKDSKTVWLEMITRMHKRGIRCNTFMTNGSKHIEEAVQTIYPSASMRIYYHRAYRDKEIMCCLTRLPINNKLINDSLKAYETLKNEKLNQYLEKNISKSLEDIVLLYPEQFIKRLKERLDSRPKIRVEGLSSAFQSRFEKFHMLKDDPIPVVNGWIARWMLSIQDFGFSRLSIYMQVPCPTSYKQFACGQIPEKVLMDENDPLLRGFVIEVAARCLQIPVFYSKCEMKLDKCSLF